MPCVLLLTELEKWALNLVMIDQLELQIQPSKTYLILTIVTYFLNLFSAWYFFYDFWLSAIISIALSVWLYYFLPKRVLLTRPSSITKITLDQAKITIKKNDGSTQQYPWFYPAYQSRFLVIIEPGKEQVVIFKDAIESQSLSTLNRLINANT